MSDYVPIDCGLYDHVELACMHRYRLRVTTRDDQILTGTAIDTRVDSGRQEYLVLKAEDRELLIRLDAVTSIEPLSQGAQFGKVRFDRKPL